MCWRKILIVVLLSAYVPLFGATGFCDTENNAFGPGEKVYYDAYYNWKFIWLNAGKVTFTVDEAKWRGKPAYFMKSIGVTERGYDRLFRVRDTFEVYVDPLKLTPFEYRQITNEGSYSASHHYIFNEDNRSIRTNISRENSPFQLSFIDWPECTFDILSMIYKARNIDFSKYKKNDKIPITMIIDGEIHNLYIRYLGKEVARNRDGRRFNCLKFSPLLVEGTIFSAGEDMTVWVTDDKNRVPIVVEAKILIGSVKAVFTHADGLRHPLTSEIKR
ncbi:DUF3108 domain-containing protein [Natronoflexus pectinivorans]|uniref:Uncharacterized protein DUF3108 n=1 Tax=Natronoflexus pectinivorans TaxID=682526 RepID=A0A4R2GI68_9BACT|nr:DUF3108 domain-containing protein [Natronoflexus pectinivorans]TCO07900.1 uncharacterized protein DUF3108 [Natronoflexus pectinivorans]